MKTIAIWHHISLPLSELFIADQLSHLREYDPILFARRMVNQDVYGFDRSIAIMNSGTLHEKLDDTRYLLTRHSSILGREFSLSKPSLIHAHFGIEGVYALKMKRKFQVPLVTTFHGFDATMDHPPGGRPRVTWWMYRHKKEELIKEGDLFIAVSSSIRDKLLAQGFPEEKTIVHHIGVDPDRLPVNRSLSRETLSRLVTVGRMVEKKGFLDLISAFSLMSNELPSISLDIIGDGALRPRIEAKIKSLGLQQRIRLHGALPYQETHRLVSEADLFCLPSKVASNGDTEGLPISILEAMSMGVPVVSTRHSGIPDAVLEGKTGLMVNEGDIQGLTTACLRILTDAELWLKFSRNSRIRIEERFDIRLQTARLESEYERLTR